VKKKFEKRQKFAAYFFGPPCRHSDVPYLKRVYLKCTKIIDEQLQCIAPA